ncbi:MAG: protein-glutamate O-methyltransferase CheR [Kangiellaceae bacterium]|nr:protein-glutamate O-methyltransferase CheR [Kangiellaceae bacterium]
MELGSFKRWQALIRKYSGIWIPSHREIFLKTSLLKRIRELHLTGYDEYYQKLQDKNWASLEWFQLIDALTIHETSFFRHKESFDLVQHVCQQKIVQSANAESDCNIQLWSVGCSTGEEPYSLAIALEELSVKTLNEKGLRFFYGITGIDISYPALSSARQAIYSERKLHMMSQQIKEKYFNRHDDQHWQVKEDIRNRVLFLQSNLNEIAKAPKRNYDVIYCQNVLIYFQPEDRIKILEALVERLIPGGVLILGVGEIINWNHPLLSRINDKNCLAYQRQI